MKNRTVSLILSTLLNRYMYSMGMIAYAFDPNDEADKAILKAAIEEATAPLVAKNKEILGELKDARKGQQISPEVVEKLEAQIDTLKTELGTAQGAAREATKKAEQAAKSLEAETGFTQKLLVDNGLGDALVKANVTNPAHLKAVKSMLSGQVKIVVDGESRKAMVGDKELSAFVTEWAASDEGKHFVTASSNSGGGSNGGGGGGSGKTIKQSDFDALGSKERAAKMADGYIVTE